MRLLSILALSLCLSAGAILALEAGLMGLGHFSEVRASQKSVPHMPPIIIPEPPAEPNTAVSARHRTEILDSRPNVIVVYTDDQSFEEVGYFNERVYSPNIDRIFSEGLVFPNARVTTSMCTPSRYGLHTGLRASSGIVVESPQTGRKSVEFNMELTEQSYTIGRALQSAGYRTGFVGKWHLGGYGSIEHNRPDTLPPQALLDNRHHQDIDVIMKRGGFDYVAGQYMQNPKPLASRNSLPKEFGIHNPGWVTAGALEFLHAVADREGNPFFLLFAPTLIHAPQLRRNDDPLRTPYGNLEKAPESQPGYQSVRERVSQHLVEQAEGILNERRLRSIVSLDDGIGAILQALENLQLSENTIMIFMSDNSDAKGSIYDDGLRVPMAVYWPGVIEAGQSPALVSNIDIFATLAELIGVEPENTLDGISFLPALFGKHDVHNLRNAFIGESGYARTMITKDGWQYVALRLPDELAEINSTAAQTGHFGLVGDEQWRIDELHPGYFNEDQLYDLNSDPNALKNLAYEPEYSERLDEMKRLLRHTLENDSPAFAGALQ